MTREVVVLAKPGDVPATVQVDISGVDLSEMVRLEEVEAPENTKLVFTQNAPVFIAGGLSSIMSDEDEEEGEGEGEEGAEDEAAEAEE